ncbi:MAG: DNA-processing protein DprA [Candidatus Limnocylindrales bacterium]
MLGIGAAGPTGSDPSDDDRQSDGSLDDRPTGSDDRARRAADDAEREAWIVLASVQGLGPIGFGRLLRRFGNGRSVLATASDSRGGRALAAALRGGPDEGIAERPADAELAERIVLAAARTEALLDVVRRHDLTVVTLEERTFPDRLLQLEMPPHLLFVRGDVAALSRQRAVAVVGTRRPTEYGRRVAARIAAAISDAGGTVVSGLAIGIDGAAHAAAVATGAPTVAVLGGGHGHLFPRAHERLGDEIVAAGGAVVAELFPDERPTRGTFPRRNRLISGLADATVVVEAPLRSGALITAAWALEQGRECHLVPGPIDAPMSAGCLAFLRENSGLAHPVATIPDLIDDLGFIDPGPRHAVAVAQVELGPIERRIVAALVDGATTTDEILQMVREPVATILGGLTLLEMRGLLTSAYGRYRLAGRLSGSEVA